MSRNGYINSISTGHNRSILTLPSNFNNMFVAWCMSKLSCAQLIQYGETGMTMSQAELGVLHEYIGRSKSYLEF